MSDPEARLGEDAIDRFELNGIELTWDPEARLGVFRFLDEDTVARGKDAPKFLGAFRTWTDGSDTPYAVLVDSGRLSNVDAAWRSAFSAYFKNERDRVFVAWFNANVLVRTMVLMFVTAMRVGGTFEGKAFATEEEARSWLRGKGIKA